MKKLFYIAIMLVLVPCRAQHISGSRAPNVIIVICDDLNDAIHGMGGHPQALTPNLDKLAAMGIRFTTAQCNAPLCGPSRASLWSGLYPHTTGYYGYKQQPNHWRNNPILKNTVTLFEHFAENGYQVFATGKIHHNGHEDKSIFENSDGSNGFRVDASFGPYPWDGDPATATLQKRGVMHPDLPASFMDNKWTEGFGEVRNISGTMRGKGSWLYDHRGKEYRISSASDRDLMPDEACTQYAISLLEKKHEKPFLLAIGFNRPHSPQYVPKKYFDLYGKDTLVLSPSLEGDLTDCAPETMAARDVAGVNIGKHKYGLLMKAGGEDLVKQWTRAYLASVSFVDDQLGQLVKALEESPNASNTLLIFTSDHGYHMGEKGLIFKNTTWEESTRVPFLVAGPGVARGKECTTPVSLIDLYPTLVEYCHLPPSPNEGIGGKKLDGHSMMKLFEDPDRGSWEGPGFALTAIFSQAELEIDQPGPADQQHYSLRTDRYRYIRYRNGEEELYDHFLDPYEWTNLSGDKAQSKILNTLRTELITVLDN